MASLLDLLKAKGIDPTKISSSLNEDKDDAIDKDLTDDKDSEDAVSPAAIDKLSAPSLSPSLLATLSSPQASSTTPTDDVPTPTPSPGPLAQSTSDEKLPVSVSKSGVADTDVVPQTPTDQGDTFAGFPKSYDTVNDLSEDPSDDGDDKQGGSSKTSQSLSFKGSVAAQQAAALQAAINKGGFTNNTVEGLKAAQDAADAQKSKINLLRGLSQIATGALGANFKAKTDNSATIDNLKGLDKEADQGVQNFKDRGEQEKNDPKSALSVGARAFAAPMLAKMGMTLPENVSYAGMEKLSPQLTKLYDTKTAQEAHSQDLAVKYATLNEMKRQSSQGKADQQDVKRLDTANKMITSGLASSRSGFGKDAANLMAVQNAKALLEGGNLDDIDTRQIAETSRVLDRILSNGAPTQSGTEHLTPETARMKIAKQLEFYTNQRQGAGAGSFLQNTVHTLDREENIAKQRTQATMQQALGSYKDIAERNPALWDSMVASHPEIANIMSSQALKAAKSAPKSLSPGLTTPSGVSSAPSSGKVRVSNGKETLEIDPSDLPHAQSDGYKQVN